MFPLKRTSAALAQHSPLTGCRVGCRSPGHAMDNDCWDDASLARACVNLTKHARNSVNNRRPASRSASGPPAKSRAKPLAAAFGTRSSLKAAAKSKSRPRPTPPVAEPPRAEASRGHIRAEELEPYLGLLRWPCAGHGSVIRVGSDCSGLESLTGSTPVGCGRSGAARVLLRQGPCVPQVPSAGAQAEAHV